MAEWNFFAFNANRASLKIFVPVLDIVKRADLTAWQKWFQSLQHVHRPTRYAGYDIYPNDRPITDVQYHHRQVPLTDNEIPELGSPSLRWLLQDVLETIAVHYLEGNFPRPHTWIVDEPDLGQALSDEKESEELELLKREIFNNKNQLPEPFWFLGESETTFSAYVSPKTVETLARVEMSVGLLRRLEQRQDLSETLRLLAPELAALGLLMELAANRKMGLYYREDAS